MTATRTILIFRPPLIEGRRVVRSYHVRAGEYLTERGERVIVPEQIGDVDGWHYDYPNMQVYLRVEVCRG